MSNNKRIQKITTNTLQEMKQNGERKYLSLQQTISSSNCRWSRIDIILVGDSGNVIVGNETTLPITLNREMIYHASSVVKHR